MRFPTQRRELLDAARRLYDRGLVKGSSGNLSVRVDDGMLVTATGVAWDALTLDDVVDVRADGRVSPHQPAPSSEWRLHLDLYTARGELSAVVHTHSMFCTTLSILRCEIPAAHYMIAVAGTSRIRCAAYATFGSAELSRHAVAALEGAKACLLANHGMVAAGANLVEALRVTEEIETLAEQYWRALQVGTPVILTEEQLADVRARFVGYGQPKPRRWGAK